MTSLWQQSNYALLQHQIKIGDVIAFGGNSLFSRWAKLTTQSVVTHLAIVIESSPHPDVPNGVLHKIIEATSYKGRSGVMINHLCERSNSYAGNMWWLPLSEESRQIFTQNQTSCLEFLLQQQNKPYDIWQLFGSAVDATDNLPLFKYLSNNTEDFTRWFCSELVAAALRLSKLVHIDNASEITPIDICRYAIFHTTYTQFVGEQTEIAGFNTLPPPCNDKPTHIKTP